MTQSTALLRHVRGHEQEVRDIGAQLEALPEAHAGIDSRLVEVDRLVSEETSTRQVLLMELRQVVATTLAAISELESVDDVMSM